jgi:hypothetical protein
MDALSNFLGRELMKAINEKREAHLRVLVGGQAVDYPDYRARSHYLRALADVEQMITDINLDDTRRTHGFAGSDEARSRRASG